MLQMEGVGDVEQDVGQQYEQHRPILVVGQQAEGQAEQHGHGGDGTAHADLARGQRPVAFGRMAAVGLDVEQVVEDIDAAGHGRKGAEHVERLQNGGPLPLVGKDKAQKDKAIFNVLVRAQQFQKMFIHGVISRYRLSA